MENGVKPNIQFSAIVLPIVKYFAKAISWEPFVGRTVPENYRNRLELVEMFPAGEKKPNTVQMKYEQHATKLLDTFQEAIFLWLWILLSN